MSRCSIFAITLAAMLASSLPALAHAPLEAASPSADATVTSAPAEVALDFSEAIEPKFSTIEVDDAKAARVDGGDVHVAPDNAKHLAAASVNHAFTSLHCARGGYGKLILADGERAARSAPPFPYSPASSYADAH